MPIYCVTAKNPTDPTEEHREILKAASRSHAILRLGALLSQSEALRLSKVSAVRLSKVSAVDVTYDVLTTEDKD